MKRLAIGFSLAVLTLLVLIGSSTTADERHSVRARLTGFQEPPSISSAGRGEFVARLGDSSVEFELTYSGLEGTVQQAHIHLGQRGVNGGIMIFLCSNLPSPPPGTAACPQSGTVTGTKTASDVIGPAGQGIAPGEFAEVLRAIRSGNTYANVHSSKHPGGEIRGQIRTDNEENPD